MRLIVCSLFSLLLWRTTKFNSTLLQKQRLELSAVSFFRWYNLAMAVYCGEIYKPILDEYTRSAIKELAEFLNEEPDDIRIQLGYFESDNYNQPFNRVVN